MNSYDLPFPTRYKCMKCNFKGRLLLFFFNLLSGTYPSAKRIHMVGQIGAVVVSILMAMSPMWKIAVSVVFQPS